MGEDEAGAPGVVLGDRHVDEPRAVQVAALAYEVEATLVVLDGELPYRVVPDDPPARDAYEHVTFGSVE